jgi:fibronectin type 3 domain-containing protein
MKFLSGFIGSVILLTLVSLTKTAYTQSVLNPNDPIVVYNPAAPPTPPTWNTIGKWVKTNRLSWNTSSFKAYHYNGFSFRLKFPTTYNPTAVDGKKYPMIIFMHGLGERGTIYDNEFQLLHGGQQFRDKVDNGTFDGYVLAFQTQNGFWGGPAYDAMKAVIDYMVVNNKLDQFRVVDNGLSAGGTGTWEMSHINPTYIAASLPMSAASTEYYAPAIIEKLKFSPIWIFQGGLDGNPDPYTTKLVRDAYLNAGGNFKYTEYPNIGHGTWNTAWAEPDFYPFVLRAHSANPWPLTGRKEFCPGDAINITIGLTPGFAQYEWRKDGVLIPGATSNTIIVTGTAVAGNPALGSYSARVRRGTFWSDWSPTPVVLTIKQPTIPPAISIVGLKSKVIPALDGSTGVPISVPNTYAAYLWQREGSTTTIGTTNSITATTPGDYKVQVTEQFGCSSEFTAPFSVIDANGTNKPDAPTNLIVSTLSKTSLRLDWNQSPNPSFNETNFEVYQSVQASGPYTLIAVTNADVSNYTATGLNPKTKYFFRLRAVNNTAASATFAEANGTTDADNQPPTAPVNLTITGTSRSSIALSWGASTDDVAVTLYNVYVNGSLAYLTTQTQFTVNNLTAGLNYNIYVKAKDAANNLSVQSNQVTGRAIFAGLPYKYYTFTGTWNNLPNFATVAAVSTGVMPNVALTPRTQNDNFAFLWEGFITIPTTGTYQFRTNSDDGSRLWLGALNGTTSPYSFTATPTVNNDGLHGSQDRTSSNLNLTAGVYPIAIAFYEQGGGESMIVSWRTPSTGTSFVTIPNSAFIETVAPAGSAPASPSAFSATAVSFKRINLSWVDNSNNETGFEIWRSVSPSSGFVTIGVTAANTTSFADTSLNPNTLYYYRLRAIGQFGESQPISNINIADAIWLFNGNLNDESGNSRILSQVNSPTYSTSDKMEGTHSIGFNGTNQSVTIPSTGSFLQTAYTERTVAFWMKSNSNTGNRVVVDLGGNDDGLAVRLDGNTLRAGIASNNTQNSLSVPYTSTGWNHIALVYSGNTFRLFVNGVLAASNTNLAFTSVTTTTGVSSIGRTNGSNAFNTATGFFNGRIDNFVIYANALSSENVVNLMNNSPLINSFATTQSLPTVPAVPANLQASGVSGSKINVTWDDVSNETSFQLYRSPNDNGNFILYSTIPSNTLSFVDSSLVPNTVFYYKVRALNEGGNSLFSNEDSAKTLNTIPVLAPVANQVMRFGTTLQFNINAVDPDPETLTITPSNLPPFASFVPTGNGTGLLSFNNPPATGNFENIIISVADQNGGNALISFNLLVNDNDAPVISGSGNITLNEMQTGQVILSATDANPADVLTWSFAGLPGFATPVINGGNVEINLVTGYADHGVYNVTATVNDGNLGTASLSFIITINNVNPDKKVFVNFNDGTLSQTAPWNNTNKIPAINDVFPALKDNTGATTSIGMRVMSNWQSIPAPSNTGVNTGNNSGIYPDNVMRSFWFTTDVTQTLQINGLTPSVKYNFTFFGSRGGVTDDRTTLYTIGSTTVSLNAANNSQNTVSINNLSPNPDGTLTLNLNKGPLSQFGYLNAMVIDVLFDDGTAPAKPRNLTGIYGSNSINLAWVDAAYNEKSYEVYRSVNGATGPYTLLNSGGNNPNLQSYGDANVSGNKTYHYYVIAKNDVGISPSSDTIAVSTPNTSPLIAAIANVAMKQDQIVNVNISATDDPGDVITIQVNGLPSFATFTPTGNGTGTIAINPGSTKGTFNGITVTATDQSNASSSRQFNIVVTDKNITSYYVNFNSTIPVGAPWNSFNRTPTAGAAITNVSDEAGTGSAIGVTLVDAWTDGNTLGGTTGNNSGVYPDNVMQTFYYTDQTTARRIRITGLPNGPNQKYNLVLFASRGGVADNRTTIYASSGQSVSLNAASNTSNTVQLGGLIPDASGVIEFTAQKDAGAPFGYINAMVIQSYIDNGIPLAPQNLTAAGLNTTIQLNWSDGSNNEEGFEVHRSTSINGTYTLLTTTAANATTYTDATVQVGTLYYYKVRAKRLTNIFSDYSNVAAASTILYTIDLNFNDGSSNPAQGGNWNNTNTIIQSGFVLSNLKNRLGQNTGMNFGLSNNFTGYNVFGAQTGNNSGIYPDNVMAGFYYVVPGDTTRWKFDGLNISGTYNFIFFGSRKSPTPGAVTTTYRIGNQIVTLDATDNTSRVARINGVKPDSTGTVHIMMYTVAGYGYINAMTIEGALSAENNGSQGGGSGGQRRNSQIFVSEQTTPVSGNTATTQNANSRNRVISKVKASAYPNPFMDEVMMKFELPIMKDRIVVSLVDQSGRLVFSRELRNVPQGISQFPLGIKGNMLAPGVYFLRLDGIDTDKQSLKLIKK